MHFTCSSRGPSLFNSRRKEGSRGKRDKIIVIDSDNEEEYANEMRWETEDQLSSFSLEPDISRKRGKSSCNMVGFASKYASSMDGEIFEAEKQVQKLQKQCELLEKMIVGMIKEQAELKVQERRKERRKSEHRERKQIANQCPIHKNRQPSLSKEGIDQLIKLKLTKISVHNEQDSQTLLLSQMNENSCALQLEAKKTTQLKANKSKKCEQQNIQPIESKIKRADAKRKSTHYTPK